MAPLGPFTAERRVAVAVSGGADSMALAFLLSRWGQPLAAIVDHGLRQEAAAEARQTAARLKAIGIASITLEAKLPAGPAAAERARAARYRLLLGFCAERGLPDLLLAHHAADQAETVQMRAASGSGAAGLAGMPWTGYRDQARLLRPLLPIPPARLRATLAAAEIAWAEDPTNRDPRTCRGRLRATASPAADADARATARHHAAIRAGGERRLAATLATLRLDPAGFAVVSETIDPESLSALIWTISGRPYPPPRSALTAGLTPRTVHGVVLAPGGRLGPGMLITREPNAAAPPIEATRGAHWDGRFRLGAAFLNVTIGALGADAAVIGRRSGLPAMVRRTLPALRRDNEVFVVPHLGFPDAAICRSVPVWFCPARPAAGAPFINPFAAEGV